MTDISVLVVDDQPLMSEALRVFIDGAPGMSCCGTAANGEEAISLLAVREPDVILMDMQMPGMNGVQAIRAITAAQSTAVVIAMTTFDPDEYLIPALKAGAHGFLLKDSSPNQVVQAIQDAHSGMTVISPAVAVKLVKAAIADRTAPPAVEELLEPLTAREMDVLSLVARGLNNQEVAAALFITEATVKAHVGHAMSKLQVRNRVQLVVEAARRGLVQIAQR